MKKAITWLWLCCTVLLPFFSCSDTGNTIPGTQITSDTQYTSDTQSTPGTQITPGTAAGPNEKENKKKDMIVSYIDKLRDPFILEHNGKYYAYGTGWHCYKTMRSTLDGTWIALGCVVEAPEDAKKDYWAPEVYRYKDGFYMFTTYCSAKSSLRGCSVFFSTLPEGPFKEISDGHVTPSEWECIDGSLYIDTDGQPWMVFVHEWTSMPDKIGSIAVAKMSDDLTHFISEPIELFRANDAPWSNSGVTDGCFLYRCKSGELLMLWSSFDKFGYAVGVARSDNGRPDGVWTNDPQPLYSKKLYPEYDGGHPMLFTSIEGQLYMAIHSPNSPVGVRKERPVFIAVEESGTDLILKANG